MSLLKPVFAKPLGTLEGLGPLGSGLIDSSGEAATSLFASTVSWIISIMTIGGGIYLLFQLILGAYSFIGSENDKMRLQKAQKQIVNSIFGFIIVAAAYGLVALLGYAIGIDILDPAETILDIWS